MKKTLRRFAALLLAVVMTLALGVSAWADNTVDIKGTIPSNKDTGTVQIGGFVDANVTVKAYKIVEATYYDTETDKQSGFKGYVVVADPSRDFVVEDGTDDNGNPKYKANYPTSTEISLLAKDVSKFTAYDVTVSKQDDGSYLGTAELPVGEYMVIAEDKDGITVYNPMLVSVYYTDNANQVAIDPITVNGSWGGGLETQDAYVKSTTPNPVKEIADSDIGDKNSGNHGNDAAIGDSVSFKISGVTIPSYSVEYFQYAKTTTETTTDDEGNETTTTTTTLDEKTSETAVVFKISDTLDKGLTLKGDIVVKVGSTTLATIKAEDIKTDVTDNDDYTYTYTAASGDNGETFEISLSKAYLKSLAGTVADARAVEVTYGATVNANATTNFDPNKNTMTVTYTNKPTTGTDDGVDKDGTTKTITDTTYHYTFEIDGKIAGKASGVQYDKTTHELIKINEKGEAIVETTFTQTSEEYEVPQAVQGAVFKLEGEGKTYYAVTDKNGYFVSFDQYQANDGPKTSFGSGASAVAGADIKGFKQMDAGSYTLQEVVAPEGFALDSKEHSVVITATYYDEDQYKDEELTAKKGQLKSYEIKIDNENTSTYEATYDNGVVESVGAIEEGKTKTTYIKNTRIPTLPSTGSTGTYAFTVIGVAVLGVAAVMVIKGRRKEK